MSLDTLSEALSGAMIEYHCGQNHVHVLTIPEGARSVDSDEGIDFGTITCPHCEREQVGWIPPSHIRGIWWGEAAKEAAQRRADASKYRRGSRMGTRPDGW